MNVHFYVLPNLINYVHMFDTYSFEPDQKKAKIKIFLFYINIIYDHTVIRIRTQWKTIREIYFILLNQFYSFNIILIYGYLFKTMY